MLTTEETIDAGTVVPEEEVGEVVNFGVAVVVVVVCREVEVLRN